MIAQKQSHVHNFDKPGTKKVLLNSGLKTAIDVIKEERKRTYWPYYWQEHLRCSHD
jgi:hypothetical protein